MICDCGRLRRPPLFHRRARELSCIVGLGLRMSPAGSDAAAPFVIWWRDPRSVASCWKRYALPTAAAYVRAEETGWRQACPYPWSGCSDCGPPLAFEAEQAPPAHSTGAKTLVSLLQTTGSPSKAPDRRGRSLTRISVAPIYFRW